MSTVFSNARVIYDGNTCSLKCAGSEGKPVCSSSSSSSSSSFSSSSFSSSSSSSSSSAPTDQCEYVWEIGWDCDTGAWAPGTLSLWTYGCTPGGCTPSTEWEYFVKSGNYCYYHFSTCDEPCDDMFDCSPGGQTPPAIPTFTPDPDDCDCCPTDCSDCCGEIIVVVSGYDGGDSCTCAGGGPTCDALNTTHTLTRVLDTCVWQALGATLSCADGYWVLNLGSPAQCETIWRAPVSGPCPPYTGWVEYDTGCGCSGGAVNVYCNVYYCIFQEIFASAGCTSKITHGYFCGSLQSVTDFGGFGFCKTQAGGAYYEKWTQISGPYDNFSECEAACVACPTYCDDCPMPTVVLSGFSTNCCFINPDPNGTYEDSKEWYDCSYYVQKATGHFIQIWCDSQVWTMRITCLSSFGTIAVYTAVPSLDGCLPGTSSWTYTPGSSDCGTVGSMSIS